ncbi:hypothetical protein ACAG24_027210 [Mycobacterium sp. pW049]|uniref:hypothetical protein n=1 Tax=[Mycobacterium] bulgaricum TaxID=3238985 RepID=UPI00351AD3AA
MSVAGKTRTAVGRGLRIQRRVAVAQALLWPVALSVGVLTLGAAAVAAKRLRRHDEPVVV